MHTSTSGISRRTIFDNDGLDNLEVEASRLHMGRKEMTLESSTSQNKAAILSALTAFDSDSDERDDTYDVDDVGGIIDNTRDADTEISSSEEALYAVWKSSPEVFAKDALTRRGRARITLKNETGMTDEAIEGWATMLGRDARQQAKLESKYAIHQGQQEGLPSTSWKPSSGNESDGEDDVGWGGRRGSQRGMRGQGRKRGSRGGRGGNVAGPASDKDTQLARHRKDANKSSRANHSRRDQRARKVARAGFP